MGAVGLLALWGGVWSGDSGGEGTVGAPRGQQQQLIEGFWCCRAGLHKLTSDLKFSHSTGQNI